MVVSFLTNSILRLMFISIMIKGLAEVESNHQIFRLKRILTLRFNLESNNKQLALVNEPKE